MFVIYHREYRKTMNKKVYMYRDETNILKWFIETDVLESCLTFGVQFRKGIVSFSIMGQIVEYQFQ